MKVIELFAGVGSQTQALKNLGIKHEVIGISEIDKYAINSYEQLHGTVNNFGDISKIDILPTADIACCGTAGAYNCSALLQSKCEV